MSRWAQKDTILSKTSRFTISDTFGLLWTTLECWQAWHIWPFFCEFFLGHSQVIQQIRPFQYLIFAFGHQTLHWWNLNPVRNLAIFIVGNGLDFSCQLAFCTLCYSCYLWFHFVKVGPSCVGLRLKSNLRMHFMDFSTKWSNVSTEAVRNNSSSNSVLTPISLRSLVRSSLSCFLLLENVNKDYYPKTWLCKKKPAPPWWRTWFRSWLRIRWKSWVWDLKFLLLHSINFVQVMIYHIWSPTRICSWGAWRVVNSEPLLLQSKFFLLQSVTSQLPNNCSTNMTRFLQ